MKTKIAITNEDWLKNYRKYVSKGHIYSEEWEADFIYKFQRIKRIYHTEFKDQHDAVINQVKIDYPGASMITIRYQ